MRASGSRAYTFVCLASVILLSKMNNTTTLNITAASARARHVNGARAVREHKMHARSSRATCERLASCAFARCGRTLKLLKRGTSTARSLRVNSAGAARVLEMHACSPRPDHKRRASGAFAKSGRTLKDYQRNRGHK